MAPNTPENAFCFRIIPEITRVEGRLFVWICLSLPHSKGMWGHSVSNYTSKGSYAVLHRMGGLQCLAKIVSGKSLASRGNGIVTPASERSGSVAPVEPLRD